MMENEKGALTGGWPQNIKAYFEIADSFRPDVVISDFESWSYLYGVNHGLPVISVDNIQIVNRCQHDEDVIAGHEASFQIAKGIVKAKVPGAYQYLITTFFRPPIRKKRTSLHPPVLRPEILAAKAEAGSHLLVYQSYTTNQELPDLLRRTGIECRIYGLRTARAVVASSGFTLMGEAVFLHKPMLAEPVAKQFEQILNARYLEKEGYGLSTDQITEARLREFLQRIPEFEANLSRYSQDGNKDLLSRLESVMNAAAKGIPAEAE